MSSTSAHTRIFAFVGALIFFVTSCALTALVVWKIHQDNNLARDAAKAISSQEDTSPSSLNTTNGDQQTADQTQTNQTTQPKEGVLQGTKLVNFTPVAKTDTLQIIDTVAGTGTVVKEGDTVTAHYTGAVAATGVIFQSSKDTGSPATFPLANVIVGWQKGVPGMKVGGTRRLVIPAAEAYGANPPANSGIPANADLVFDIELVRIGQ